MAGRKRRFSGNSNRIDPYKNFRFRLAIGAVGTVVAAIAGLGLVKRYLNPKDYLPPEPTGPRPIEGVGTTTVGRAGKGRKPEGGGKQR